MRFDPHAVAEQGRKIYDRDEFVAIDVASERLFFGDSPETAYRAAREARIEGPFHFVRFGRETDQEVVVVELSGPDGAWFFRIKEYEA